MDDKHFKEFLDDIVNDIPKKNIPNKNTKESAMEDNQQFYAVPFSLVGIFITDKSPEESINNDLTPEELEKLQDIISRMLFKEGVKVVIYPSVVPPDQVEDAMKDFEDMVFGEGE